MKAKKLTSNKKRLSNDQCQELMATLKARFENNMHRHQGIQWKIVSEILLRDEMKLWSLNEMEITGGEPDVIVMSSSNNDSSYPYVFCDCAPESPKGRRSVCYDDAALNSRKEHKPKTSAMRMAEQMGVEILTEEQYRHLQKFGPFDSKTSSWLQTPADIRKLGGAIFGDWRYGHVFIYHNGAESYYAARGFRALLTLPSD